MAATTLLQFRLQSPPYRKVQFQAFNGQKHHHQVHHIRTPSCTLLRNTSISALPASLKACNLSLKPQQTLRQNPRVLTCRALSTNEPNETPAASCAYPSLALAVTAIISALIVRVIRTLLEKYILLNPSPNGGLASLVYASSPLLFASVSDPFAESRPATALSVVAGGMAKWLELYSTIVWVRVLLSWFPNIPWDQQPLCAIRDLCDPYLNVFRNLLPPVMGMLDVSPLLAFVILGVFATMLRAASIY